jgi:hypothetical protein
MMGVLTIVLILYMGGEAVEYTHRDGISECLSVKRKIERLGWKDTRNTRYSCEKREVEFETGPDGKPQVAKLLD